MLILILGFRNSSSLKYPELLLYFQIPKIFSTRLIEDYAINHYNQYNLYNYYVRRETESPNLLRLLFFHENHLPLRIILDHGLVHQHGAVFTSGIHSCLIGIPGTEEVAALPGG